MEKPKHSRLVSCDEAVTVLQEGGIVGMPTETVYGLAGRIDNAPSIERIFTTKGRPSFDPLIVHVESLSMGKTIAEFGLISETLAAHFWPGPLTMVLPKLKNVSDQITSGLQAVGVRIPNHPVALDLIHRVGVPLAAPSANKFGKTSPSEAQHVLHEFSQDDVPVVDGGPCAVGIESTVLLVNDKSSELVVLRPGYITETALSEFLHEQKIPHHFHKVTNKVLAPGQMKHHYMPAVPLIILERNYISENDLENEINQILRAAPDFVEGVKIIKPAHRVERIANLRLPDDPVLAARALYGSLRNLAESGADAILFVKNEVHQGELWESILERLTKAATGVVR